MHRLAGRRKIVTLPPIFCEDAWSFTAADAVEADGTHHVYEPGTVRVVQTKEQTQAYCDKIAHVWPQTRFARITTNACYG